MGALEDAVDAGKVRFIGVSNFSRRQLEEAQRSLTRHRVVSNQVPYSLIDRAIEAELLPYCRETGVTVIAHSPLGQGLENLHRRDRRGALDDVSAETGHSAAQIALNWCISHEGVVAIPKASTLPHTEENCAAAGWRLSPSQIAALEPSVRERRRRSSPEVALRRLARKVLSRSGLRRR